MKLLANVLAIILWLICLIWWRAEHLELGRVQGIVEANNAARIFNVDALANMYEVSQRTLLPLALLVLIPIIMFIINKDR